MSAPASSRFSRYLTVILRWLSITFVVFVLTMLAGKYITEDLLPKVYTATAQIQVSPPGLADGPIETIRESQRGTLDPTDFQAEFVIMESPDVLLPVIYDLGLDKAWAQRIDKLDLDAVPAQDALLPQDALAYMHKILKIDLARGTNIINITASSDVPIEAARIANAVADRYKTMRDVEEAGRSNRGRDSLRDEIAQQQKIVDEKKAEVEKMRKELYGDLSIPRGTQAPEETDLNSRQKDLLQAEEDLDARRKDLLTAEEDYDARRVLLKERINLPDNEFLPTFGSFMDVEPRPHIATLLEESAHIESDIDKLLKAGAKEDDPKIVALRQEDDAKHKQLHDLIAVLRRAMQADTEMAKTRVALLQKQVDDLMIKVRDETTGSVLPFRDAQRDLDQQQNLLDALNVRLKQVNIDYQLQESPVRIISRAEVPEYPTKPNRTFVFIVTIVGAGFLSLAAASFVEIIFLFSRASKRADN